MRLTLLLCVHFLVGEGGVDGGLGAALHQLAASGAPSRDRRVVAFPFSLADTTNCSRTRNDLSLDHAKRMWLCLVGAF